MPLPKLPSLSVKLPGTPRGPAVEGVTQKFLRNVRAVASWFFGPLTEWILYTVIVYKRHMTEGVDFDRQVALTAPGINTKGFNRADFVFWPTGKAGGLGGVYHRGIVANPISFYTHPSRGKDIMERAILAQAGYRVVYIEDYDLESRPDEVVGLMLRGIDVSSRGLGYR
jgi:hypothetical protein